MYMTNPRKRRKIGRSSLVRPASSSVFENDTAKTDEPENSDIKNQNSELETDIVQTPKYDVQNTGVGYLIIRVTTADGAIPLEGAIVSVRNYLDGDGSDILSSQKTNSSGLTQKISLPAPSRSMSLSPGGAKPYSSYNVKIDLHGYNTQQYISVPIFDGITSVQNADLVPLPENGETDRNNPYNTGIFYENQSSALETADIDT